jgi:hypothetical protein
LREYAKARTTPRTLDRTTGPSTSKQEAAMPGKVFVSSS